MRCSKGKDVNLLKILLFIAKCFPSPLLILSNAVLLISFGYQGL